MPDPEPPGVSVIITPVAPSLELLSPAAANRTIPPLVAAAAEASTALARSGTFSHPSSSEPQLMDSTSHPAAAAALIAELKD